ncbi:MAG: NADH-quinone oxidoreductase subunit I [Coriobacteriia bacterium]|nr:NADH-quinone oxidoreductase subunit I [Coriobacteriia bacterium]
MIGMAKGMLTTLRYCLRPAHTVQYPKVRRELPPRSRTMFALPLDEQGNPRCTACTLCAKSCPDNAITLESEKRADGPGRVLTHYSVNLGTCMYCGLCVENCPSDGVEFIGDYERASAERDDMRLVLFDRPYVAPEGTAEAPGPAAQTATEDPASQASTPSSGGDAQ